MRRTAATLLVAVLPACALAAMVSAAAPSAPVKVPIVSVGAGDGGRVVHVPRGGQLAVQLPAHSASGYGCWLRGSTEPVLVLLEEPGRLDLMQQWRFSAAANGVGEVRFECGQELVSTQRRELVFHVLIR